MAELRAVYMGLAYEVDQHIGRLLDYLRDTDQYNDTLIVVTADHGEMLGDQYLWGKSCPLDPALKIPLIIRDPRQPQSYGKYSDEFTESIDIAPTIVDWSGGVVSPGINGRSLLPLLQGTVPERWRDHVFVEAELGEPDKPTQFQRALGLSFEQANFSVYRTNQYKYVHFNGGLPPLLFDVQQDPQENHNLAEDNSYVHVIRQLSARMLDHRMSHADHALSGLKLTAEGVI